MQAVVKTHHIKIEADTIPEELLSFLKAQYGDVEVITDPDEEYVEVTKSSWYKNIKKKVTPGDNVKIYRELHGWTQNELGQKLGGITRQNISNIENGRRAISKTIAVKLSNIFQVNVGKFI